MKQILLFLFVLTNICLSWSQPKSPIRTMDIPPVTEIMTIDGVDDEGSWSDPSECNLAGYVLNGPMTAWDGPEDHACTIRVAWNQLYLYLFVKITDDIKHNWNGTDGNNWEFDNINVLVQLDTNTMITSYDSTTGVFRYCRGNYDWLLLEDRSDIEEITSYSTDTEDGWLVEAAIPWICALPEGSSPGDIMNYLPVIGFDIWSTDSDNSDGDITLGNMESMFVWDDDDQGEPKDDMAWPYLWNNTSVLGYANLIGEPAAHEELNEKDNQISILYPNPAGDILYLSNSDNYSQLKIYSIEGIQVLNKLTGASIVDISMLDPGMYIAVIDKTNTIKFIKE